MGNGTAGLKADAPGRRGAGDMRPRGFPTAAADAILSSMTYCERITDKLRRAFQPSQLEVIDESARHAGHNAEAATLGETHFRVRITAAGFTGLSRVEQHRRINAVLADELRERVHALALEVKASTT